MDPVHIFPYQRDKENAVISRHFSTFHCKPRTSKIKQKQRILAPIVCTLFAKARILALAKVQPRRDFNYIYGLVDIVSIHRGLITRGIEPVKCLFFFLRKGRAGTFSYLNLGERNEVKL